MKTWRVCFSAGLLGGLAISGACEIREYATGPVDSSAEAGSSSADDGGDSSSETGPGPCEEDDTPCGAQCVDLDDDPLHCGSCGFACGADEVCVDGICGPDPCPAPEITCDGDCVDPENDVEHCGACGFECPDAFSCMDGICVKSCDGECEGEGEVCAEGTCLCRPGLVRCGEACVDLSANAENCGSCDRPCDSGLCEAGQCVEQCSTGLAECNGGCVSFQDDPMNCGACEEDCEPGQSCSAGACSG